MMSELIDRNALIDALMMYTWRDEDEHLIDDWDEKRRFIEDWLPSLPTIEAEPVRHGHWEMKEDPYMFFSEIPVCSVCGCIPKMRNKTAYCSNCGAKMDEVLDDG